MSEELKEHRRRVEPDLVQQMNATGDTSPVDVAETEEVSYGDRN